MGQSGSIPSGGVPVNPILGTALWMPIPFDLKHQIWYVNPHRGERFLYRISHAQQPKGGLQDSQIFGIPITPTLFDLQPSNAACGEGRVSRGPTSFPNTKRGPEHKIFLKHPTYDHIVWPTVPNLAQ